MDELLNEWYTAITEGWKRPSPAKAARLQAINRQIAECEAAEAAERQAARAERTARIEASEARIAALELKRGAR